MQKDVANAKRLLISAWKTFLRLRMRAELVAVTADLTRLDPAGAVRKLCEEANLFTQEAQVRYSSLGGASMVK